MKQNIARLTGLAMTLAVSATALILTTGVAEAATCMAASGKSCVKVTNTSSDVDSVRINGRCFWDSDSGTNYYYDSTVDRTGVPTLLTYSGRKCEGNTQTSADVTWSNSIGADNFRGVTIRNLQDD